MSFNYTSMTDESLLKKLFDLACNGFKYKETSGEYYFTDLPVGYERSIAIYKDNHTIIFDNYDHPINQQDTIIPFATLDDDPNAIVNKWEKCVKEHDLDKENYQASKLNYDLTHSDIVGWD